MDWVGRQTVAQIWRRLIGLRCCIHNRAVSLTQNHSPWSARTSQGGAHRVCCSGRRNQKYLLFNCFEGANGRSHMSTSHSCIEVFSQAKMQLLHVHRQSGTNTSKCLSQAGQCLHCNRYAHKLIYALCRTKLVSKCCAVGKLHL
jgi:hypothetical protein